MVHVMHPEFYLALTCLNANEKFNLTKKIIYNWGISRVTLSILTPPLKRFEYNRHKYP